MTDIVEKLRKVGELQGDTYSSYEVLGMIKQAQIEIERLRIEVEAWKQTAKCFEAENKEIERLRTLFDNQLRRIWQTIAAEQKQEIEKLRAALEHKP